MPACYDRGVVSDRWDDAHAKALSECELLLYRSHLLGADLAVTNFGGGNTSAKIPTIDPLTGAPVTVLWVKGSGGDLGSMDLSGFARLYQDKLVPLERLYRGREHEDEIVELLEYCAVPGVARAASIDTSLHALLPFTHIDHVHPDAVIAIAASRRSEAITREVFAGDLGWLPWQRPGFDLGVRLRDLVHANPKIGGVILAGHGLITWGDTSKSCYQKTIDTIRRAEAWLAERIGTAPAFGGERIAPRGPRKRERDRLGVDAGAARPFVAMRRKVGHFGDDAEVLEFIGSQRFEELAASGRRVPIIFSAPRFDRWCCPRIPAVAKATAAEAITRYRSEYQAYYERCRRPDSPPMRDATRW